jgi:hypothetical protein
MPKFRRRLEGKYHLEGIGVEETLNKRNKLRGLSRRANYTDRATAVCRPSWCQIFRIEGGTWSVWRIPTAVF